MARFEAAKEKALGQHKGLYEKALKDVGEEAVSYTHLAGKATGSERGQCAGGTDHRRGGWLCIS